MVGQSTVFNVSKYLVAFLFVLISVLPFVWIWSSAFKTNLEIAKNPFSLPTQLRWENIREVWFVGRFNIYLKNSVFVVFPTVLLVVFLSSLAGFALAKISFTGSTILFYLFILGLIIPVQAIIIPLFYDFNRYGLINSLLGLVLAEVGTGVPFGVFLMRSFFLGLPKEIFDAARIDGCSPFQIFSLIAIPLAKPALLSLITFQALWSWNEFLLPLLFLHADGLRTIPLGLMFLRGGRYTLNYSQISSGITIVTVPLIVIYVLFHRNLVKGITAGALKG
jgi:ABC-type glycerol-3-phosphate transport system permease component